MNTPIIDFVRKYAESGISRFHMPGHKGKAFLGFEKYDITEIRDADVLSQAEGIIKMSEDNASSLFSSAHSFYVTQGSTTAICAMLAMIKKPRGKKTTILAARNVHKAFVNACVLLDFDVEWLTPENFSSILECEVSAELTERMLKNGNGRYSAVYLTSPDYLGNIQDISGISAVCKKYGVPLLVDNAHGSYLKFLEPSMHPLDLGADMCCDSAHKTLPVLTGGAYLHVSENAPKSFLENARSKIALFSSTSPSYLILQSLDLCNGYLDEEYSSELAECIKRIDVVKKKILSSGIVLKESEPLKIVIDAKASGYLGEDIVSYLRESNIEPEFYDGDFVVLMLTPQNSDIDYERLEQAFSEIKPKTPIKKECFNICSPEQLISVREAVFSESIMVNVENSVGRICAELTVSCPPAVPVVVCGETITKEAVDILKYYGTTEIKVVKI